MSNSTSDYPFMRYFLFVAPWYEVTDYMAEHGECRMLIKFTAVASETTSLSLARNPFKAFAEYLVSITYRRSSVALLLSE